MHVQVKMSENGRKRIFSGKETRNQAPLMFLYDKVLTERKQLRFWTLSRKK